MVVNGGATEATRSVAVTDSYSCRRSMALWNNGRPGLDCRIAEHSGLRAASGSKAAISF